MSRCRRALRAGLAAALCALPVGAQQRYHTTLVTLAPPIAEELAMAFQDHDGALERVWCITQWDSTAIRTRSGHALTIITISAIVPERDVRATQSHVEMDPRRCRRPDGRADPLLHSHPRGMCQASPADNEAILQRMAPFDGILCGDRYTVWSFVAQLLAVLTLDAQTGRP